MSTTKETTIQGNDRSLKILVTNHWMKKLGGSKTFTYTLAMELIRQGHEVDLFTNVPGMVSNKMYQSGVGHFRKTFYDIILANHHTTVREVSHLGKMVVQTCHGTIPKLEQPSPLAKKLVAISEEVAAHVGTDTIIRNGIDCERFSPSPLPDRLETVLSLAHSEEANVIIRHACRKLGVKLLTINKYRNPIWDIEKMIKKASLVISLGRGAYEAMACGRPVVVFDKRPYQASLADGYITRENITDLITTNCSGRFHRKQMDSNALANELAKYNPADGAFLREYALKHFNIEHQAKAYLNLA